MKELVRHFIRSMLSPQVLTDVGSDYLRRTLFGMLAVLLVAGIFIPRVLFQKYTDLSALTGSAAYRLAVQADTLMMIAIPMVIIGLVAVIAGPLLFPDDTDYRVLSPLPISRLQLFTAKLLAVAAVVVTAVVAINAVSTFWFPLATSSRKAEHAALARITAHAIASVAASLFMFVAVMAVQGLTIVLARPSWQRRVNAVVQASMCAGLLLSFPLVSRLPTMTVTAETVTRPPLQWLPAAWFLGVERWWLDGAAAGGYVTAARMAAVALGVAIVLVAGAYLTLYRSAERLAGSGGADTNRRRRIAAVLHRLPFVERAPAATIAIVEFIRLGLVRSRLHQFVFLLTLSAGIALLIGQILAVIEGSTPFASRPGAAISAAVVAPLLAALVFALGLRSAVRWPLDRGAAWVFRLTEAPAVRPAILNGTWLVFAGGSWAAAMMTIVFLQPRVLGPAAWSAAVLTTLAVLILTEYMLLDWRRVPFACSYLPGKHVLAYHMGVLFAEYFVFVVILGNLIRWCALDPWRTVALGGWLLALWAALGRARLRSWGLAALEFEDDDPFEARRLGLTAD